MASTTRSVLIEVGDEAAGVLVEGAHGSLTLHAVHPQLVHMHGSVYRSVPAAESAVREALKVRAKA